MRKNILITGLPRSGKSTLLKRIIASQKRKVGFVTNELIEDGRRVGFEIETSHGERAVLAHVDLKSVLNVSKYGVDVGALDLIIPHVSSFAPDDLLYLDEIAQMELFSEPFKELVTSFLDAPNTCIATLSQVYDDEFTQQVKKREDIIIVALSPEDREKKEAFIEALLKKIVKARRYASEAERFVLSPDAAAITTDHGVRHLKKTTTGWLCDCDFCTEHCICSHLLALEEYLRMDRSKTS